MHFPKKTPEYDDLHELQEVWQVIYGPVQSRRLGLSLGINLLGPGDKVCSFDCPYCDVGLTKTKMSEVKNFRFPTISELEEVFEKSLVEVLKDGRKLDSITFSGNGEPTLHPEFAEAVKTVASLRKRLCPEVKVAILSNGVALDSSKIVLALNLLDERILKLDAGNDVMLKKINSPLTRLNIKKLINGCSELKDLTLQSLFLQGKIDNSIPNEVDDWIEVVGMIKPKAVQLCTLEWIPPTSGLRQVPKQRLKEIAELLTKRTQITAQVFA